MEKILKTSGWPKYFTVILTASLLGGCYLSIGKKIPTNYYCLITKPITFSDEDAKKTISGIDSHNRVFEGLCVDQ